MTYLFSKVEVKTTIASPAILLRIQTQPNNVSDSSSKVSDAGKNQMSNLNF